MLRVIVIDESQDCADVMRNGLVQAGYEVVLSVSSAGNLLTRVRELQPDVIVIGTDSPSRDSLEQLCVLSNGAPRPIVMFTQDDGRESIRAAVRAGVTAYVVDGLDPKRIGSILEVALARFAEHQALKVELERSKSEIAERKSVDRAKGILMKQRGWNEDKAYQALRRMAMDRNIRLGQAAEQVIAVAKLLA